MLFRLVNQYKKKSKSSTGGRSAVKKGSEYQELAVFFNALNETPKTEPVAKEAKDAAQIEAMSFFQTDYYPRLKEFMNVRENRKKIMIYMNIETNALFFLRAVNKNLSVPVQEQQLVDFVEDFVLLV